MYETMMNNHDKAQFLMDMRESMKLDEAVENMIDTEGEDMVNSPPHYRGQGLESIEVIDAFVPDPYSYYMGNVLKYVMRSLSKNGKQDLEKAKWYLDKMIGDYND